MRILNSKKYLYLGFTATTTAIIIACLALFFILPDTFEGLGLILSIVCVLLVFVSASATFVISRNIDTAFDELQDIFDRGVDGDVDDFDKGQSDSPLVTSLANLLKSSTKNKVLCEGILKGLPTPYLLVDTDEKTLFTNRETLDMLQLDGPVENQLGKTLADIFYNEPSRVTAVSKAMHQGEVFKNLEVTIHGHKGGVRHVLANVYSLNDANGKSIGGFCLYIDMTALKEKEDELAERNSIVMKAADMAEEISDQLASATEELSAQIEESSVSSNESMKFIASVAASVEQMNGNVVEVARKASETAELSTQSRQIAAEGEDVVCDVVDHITRLEKEAGTLYENMRKLSEEADSIESIMSVINDIADQTNLLALNAAIEAARAGEAGRGFAVVADEVRKLAEKTMEATSKVEENIKIILHSTEENSVATEATVNDVREAVVVAGKAGESLEKIVKISSKTSDEISSIAAASGEQSSASEEISRSTEKISLSAEQNSEAMAESASAIRELAHLATELREVIREMRG